MTTETRIKDGTVERWNLDHPLGLYFAAYSAKVRKDTRKQHEFTKRAEKRLNQAMGVRG